MNDIVERVNKVFNIVFAQADITITMDTCADDIEGWDSLQHISLISMLEQEFKIEFNIDQIISMENVGDMVNVIETIIS